MSDIPDTGYKYALKCIYNAHTSDVRAVKALPNPSAGFLTGSRDSTVKVFVPDGKSFKEADSFIAGSAFISSLCLIPKSSEYPNGLILAGSNDCTIYGFSPDLQEPVFKLKGHSGPVCCLTYVSSKYFVSASWDKTARIWSGKVCVTVLEGHKETVWATAVFPSQKTILTGSADKTICLWGSGGVCIKTFTGHEDCVRGLAIISDAKFVSCANDCTVRLWLTNGDCTNILKQHSDYIYSIALLDNGTDFVTCGEDQTIRIWKDGICAQTVVLASKSLWSVVCLVDGNLVIGASGGKVYVLEKVPVDYFEKAAVTTSEQHVNPPSSMIGGDSDIRSSIYNGERLVFYECDNNVMYVCEYNNESGTKVTKELFDLKFIQNTFYKKPPVESTPQTSTDAKDYTFQIDIQGMYYDLSFNRGENPWEVANRFVTDHNLLIEHVGQIVDYIIRNTPDASIVHNDYFPVELFNTYQTVYIVGLESKLIEFSEQVPKENYISPAEIKDLVKLADLPDLVTVKQLSSLDKAILWDDEFLFPVLDLLRICVKCKPLHTKFASKGFVNYILRIFIESKMSVNRGLVAKIICNMFGNTEMEALLAENQKRIFDSIKEASSLNEESIQKACSSLFLNFAVATGKGFDIDAYSFCVNIKAILDKYVVSDGIYRLLLAIGTICTHNAVALTYFHDMGIKNSVKKFEIYKGNFKIETVAKLLQSSLTYYQY